MILVTGAGGSIGAILCQKLLNQGEYIKAFDIDEYSLANLHRQFPNGKLKVCEGDIKDWRNVEFAMKNCESVIHIAASKMVDVSSNNPVPCIRTNVDGTINLIEQAIRQNIDKFLFVSSDKAIDWSSVYGATKFLGERLTLWASRFNQGRFSVIRMGNVRESRGNVFEIWEQQKQKGEPITLTDKRMLRYFWSVNEATDFILKVFGIMEGGEIFIPNMTKYRMIDLAKQFSNKIKVVGIRPEEQLNAWLYSPNEEKHLTDLGDMWVLK
jgi:UDP-N-acetylglucosamine 4,6-dehydratase